MADQVNPPKPELDLPLPRLAEASAKRAEKEIPAEAHLASQGQALRSYSKTNILKSKFFLSFVALSFIIAFLIGGFVLGRNSVLKELNPSAPAIPSPGPVIYDPTPTINPIDTGIISDSETKGWKKYTNDKLGISFEFPASYTFTATGTLITILSPLNPGPRESNQLQNGELKIEINVSNSPENDSLEKYLNNSTDLSIGKTLAQNEEIIDGKKVIRIKWEGLGQGETIIAIHNLKRLSISKYPLETSRNNEFSEILSTFRFTQ